MTGRGRRIAILVEDDYEDVEFWYPYYRLREAGFTPVVVGPGQKDVYRSKHSYEARVDIPVAKADPDSFEGVIVPGGFAPDRLRRHREVVEFVRIMDQNGKMVAAICHGPSVLVSANVLQHRKATCFASIKDDVINAGARYMDEEVVVHDRMITSRGPADLPSFMKAMLALLG